MVVSWGEGEVYSSADRRARTGFRDDHHARAPAAGAAWASLYLMPCSNKRALVYLESETLPELTSLANRHSVKLGGANSALGVPDMGSLDSETRRKTHEVRTR